MKDATLYYLQQAAVYYELMTGSEHPLVAEIYSKISLRYNELKKPIISLNWMRKSYSIFFSTLGIFDEVVKRCYEYVRRKEANFSTEFAEMGMEQMCTALVEKFALGLIDDWGDDELVEDGSQTLDIGMDSANDRTMTSGDM